MSIDPNYRTLDHTVFIMIDGIEIEILRRRGSIDSSSLSIVRSFRKCSVSQPFSIPTRNSNVSV